MVKIDMSDEKKPVGRPTKYSPAMCDKVIEMGNYGASKAEMYLELGISHDAFHNYVNEFPEFNEAVKHATRLAQGWWEREGRKATFGASPGFNATSFIFNMKNRFKEDWKDKVETEHSGEVKHTGLQIVLNSTDKATS